MGPTNEQAFRVLTGRNDRHIILTFKKRSSGGDDDDDDDDDDDCSEDEDDDDDDDECGNSELKTVVNLICYGRK